MSQPILCPHCRNVIAIKDRKPGRFRIKCPTCGEAFALTVPREPDAPAVASTLEAPARPKPAPVPDTDETAEEPASRLAASLREFVAAAAAYENAARIDQELS